MIVIAWLPVIVLVLGLLLYVLPVNAKLQELGRIMFFCGLLALCFAYAGRTVRIG